MRRAIVLAGGLGTRLRPVSQGLPKALVEVAGRPLIGHQIERLVSAGITEIIIATGHGADRVETALEDGSSMGAHLQYSREDSPRGTGGALALAARDRVDPGDTVVVVNGDLLSRHDLAAQVAAFESTGADVSIHVREVEDPRPFGVVVVDEGRIVEFHEKPADPPAHTINAGTYLMRGDVLLGLPDTVPLSLERDVFPGLVSRGRIVAHRDDADFLDVGTPESLDRARREWQA